MAAKPSDLPGNPQTYRELSREFWANMDTRPSDLARLRLAASVRLLVILPLLLVPTAYQFWHMTVDFGHDPVNFTPLLLWLSQAVVWILASMAIIFCCRSESSVSYGFARALTYLALAMEIGTNQSINYAVGTLASPTPLFLIFIVATYRVFFDYRLALTATIGCSLVFAVQTGLELGGFLVPHPILEDYMLHPAWAEPAYGFGTAQSVILGLILIFFLANFSVNQSHKLHRYITESVLQRYLPKALVERASLGLLRLDGQPERRKITVLFTDLVGFTPMSEKLGPAKLAEVLNTYLSNVADLANDHGATVDKFIGDAAMILFGAPETMDEKAQAARAIALAQAIHEMAEAIEAEPGHRLCARSGINTGDVVLGMFGSKWRSDYTVLGPAVNIAARLESAGQPGRILLGEDTASLLGDDVPLESIGPVKLKGVSHEIEAFFLL